MLGYIKDDCFHSFTLLKGSGGGGVETSSVTRSGVCVPMVLDVC